MSITSWLNAANHNHVGFGSTVGYTLLTLFNYVITALTAHQVGYKIYSALHLNAQANLVNPDDNIHEWSPESIEPQPQRAVDTIIEHFEDEMGSKWDISLNKDSIAVGETNVNLANIPPKDIKEIFDKVKSLLELEIYDNLDMSRVAGDGLLNYMYGYI